MDKREHQALDGSVVAVTGEEGSLAERALSHLVYKAGSIVAEFEWGPRGFADQVAEWLNADYDEEFDYEGGLLRFATAPGPARPQQLAGWIGQSFDLKTTIQAPSREELVDIMTQITIDENPSGIQLASPSSKVQFPVAGYPPSVTQFLTGVGLVEVFPMTLELADALPDWAGARVRGGEMFIEEGTASRPGEDHRIEEGEGTTLLVVSTTTASRFYVDEGRLLSDAVSVASEVTAEWRPAQLTLSGHAMRQS